jgi:hypothetical protein
MLPRRLFIGNYLDATAAAAEAEMRVYPIWACWQASRLGFDGLCTLYQLGTFDLARKTQALE